MNYEDRLQQAKQEKSLADAPMLRRAILRTRWFGLIGGTLLIIGAIRGIINSIEVLDDTAMPLILSIIGGTIAVSIFILSRMTNSVAQRFDMAQLSNVLGRLKAVLIAQIILVLSSAVYTVVILSDTEINPLPFLFPSLVSLLLVSMWMLDITKGRAEIGLMPSDAFHTSSSEPETNQLSAKGNKLKFILWMIAVSGIGSALCSGIFWYLASYRLDWLTENFTSKPIGLIEPFDAYEQYRNSRGDYSLWDEWTTELVADGTMESSNTSVQSEVDPSEILAPAEETAQYETETFTHSPEVYKILNRKVFFFDFVGYFILFSLLFIAFQFIKKSMQQNSASSYKSS